MDQRPDGHAAPNLRPDGIITWCLAALVLTAATALAGETSVYRCTDADGSIELSQFPCPADSKGNSITVEDRKTGWKPPTTGVQGQTKDKGSSRDQKRGKVGRQNSAQARRDEQCWNKHQLLDEVNWKLRRGYKAGTGVALRRKRRAYEDYIDRYCD